MLKLYCLFCCVLMHLAKYLTDVITELPNFLKGLSGIQTPNDDKHSPSRDRNWLCFDINTRAAVYVLYDRRATDQPSWLKDHFHNEDISTASTTDTGMGAYEVYYQIHDPGAVCVGGNDAPGVASNYLVLAGPMVDISEHPSHRVAINNLVTHSKHKYKVSTINSKDPYYVDRKYTLGELPLFMQFLNGVLTANGDCPDPRPNDDKFVCFDIEERARVFVMHDRRITTKPVWLKEKFVDQHEQITESTDRNMGHYEIFSGEFERGRVCLGSNGCTPALDKKVGCSMYIVVVAPQEWEPNHPGSAAASARYFDGSNDYVALPKIDGGGKKGVFNTLTIDTWIKWLDVKGNHPIMNEDGWTRGDVHYQIYASEFGFDVNGAGDQTFQWQPRPLQWYFISVVYSTSGKYIKLYVNNAFKETIKCRTCTVPISLDSPRCGYYRHCNTV